MGMRTILARVDAASAEQLSAGTLDTRPLIDKAHAAVWGDGADASVVGLGKLWHAIHFLLTDGKVWETEGALGPLILGGDPVGEDVGYGPARLHRPEAVAGLNAALAASSDDVLRGRFDPSALMANQIYPTIWDEPEEDLWEEITHYMGPLRSLLKEAADAGDAILVFTA